jgi:hypothetical protein
MLNMVLALIAAVTGATPAEPAAPLAPLGQWAVNGDANGSCILTRDYGSADNPVTIAFQP